MSKEIHIAIVERTEGMDEAQFAKVMAAHKALENKIPGVQILIGKNTAGSNDKFSHGVIVIADDLEAYNKHAELAALLPEIEALKMEGFGVDFVDGDIA